MRIAIYHDLGEGGALRACAYIAAGLRSLGHELFLYTPTSEAPKSSEGPGFADPPSTGSTRLRAACHRVRELPVGPPGTRLEHRQFLVRYFFAHRDLADQVHADQCEVTLLHPSRYFQAPPLLAWSKTPCAYYAQEPRRRTYERSLIDLPPLASVTGITRRFDEAALGRIDRFLAERAHLLLVNSRFSAESIYRAYGVTARLVPLGVDGDTFSLGAIDRCHQVVAVGGLEPQKGHELAIDALGELPIERRPLLLIVYGRGKPERVRALSMRAAQSGVEVEFRSSVTDFELAQCYQSSIATLCLSRLEPFGLTSLESLACGTPVLAVAEGGYREVVQDGTNGLLVSPFPRDVMRGLLRISDGDLQMAADGLRRSVWPRWSWSSTAGITDSILHELAMR